MPHACSGKESSYPANLSEEVGLLVLQVVLEKRPSMALLALCVSFFFMNYIPLAFKKIVELYFRLLERQSNREREYMHDSIQWFTSQVPLIVEAGPG